MAINLLLRDIQEKRRKERQVGSMMLGATSLIFVMVVTYVVLYMVIQREEADLAGLNRDLTTINEEIVTYKQFEERKTEFDNRNSLVEVSIAGELALDKMLNEVSMIIPTNVWLTSLNLGYEGGFEVSGYTYDFPSVAQWLIMNDKMKLLEDIWLNNAAKTDYEGNEMVQFSSKARVPFSKAEESAKQSPQGEGGGSQ
ncbi:MAG: PilN domain-containing protein [Actinomycetota bacterium]|nr:PilN domain-containing protein [Actinomycetota bacterium]